ncbi:hypothetical protein P4S72_24180 [Vibrio sp. PP-XX7]
MAPGHIAPSGSIWIVLIEEVVFCHGDTPDHWGHSSSSVPERIAAGYDKVPDKARYQGSPLPDC